VKKWLLVLSMVSAVWVQGSDQVLTHMSLEDKVGQVFMGFIYGTELTAESRRFLEETHLGNIIYYGWANGLETPEQVTRLSQDLAGWIGRSVSVPPIIAIDQEGGIVSRFGKGFTPFPGNMALAATGNPQLTYLAAKAMGEEMRAVGVTLDLAPVLDVNDNPDNPIIGVRSYSTRSATATRKPIPTPVCPSSINRSKSCSKLSFSPFKRFAANRKRS